MKNDDHHVWHIQGRMQYTEEWTVFAQTFFRKKEALEEVRDRNECIKRQGECVGCDKYRIVKYIPS